MRKGVCSYTTEIDFQMALFIYSNMFAIHNTVRELRSLIKTPNHLLSF